MRILIFADIFGAISTTFIYNEVIELAKEHTVKFVCTKRENVEIFPFENVVEIPFELKKLTRRWRWELEKRDISLNFKNIKYKNEIDAVISEFKPNLIHCHFGYEALKILENSYSSNIPYVISFRGYDASQMLRRNSYVNLLSKYTRRLNVHSTFVCEFLLTNVIEKKVPLNKTQILYSGTNLSFFKRSNYLKKKKFIFLQISGFGDKKGHKYTIRAYAKFVENNPNHNSNLILAGNGKHLAYMKRLVGELKLENVVRFPGKVEKHQSRELLEEASCFVHHSVIADNGDCEGIPNAIMEAMAMELPILSTFHGGISELVENEVNGYLIEEKEIIEYSVKMNLVLKWGLKEINRDKIKNKFELSIHMKMLNDFYQNITNKQY